jgi:hypothetical protein
VVEGTVWPSNRPMIGAHQTENIGAPDGANGAPNSMETRASHLQSVKLFAFLTV